MAALQSTHIPIDFTHLQPIRQPMCTQKAYREQHETNQCGEKSIFRTLHENKEEFSKFYFIVVLSGLYDLLDRTNGYTLAVVPDLLFPTSCEITSLSKFEARNIVMKHLMRDAIRLCDLEDDIFWMSNGHRERFTLSQEYWNRARILGSRKCSNGYIYLVDNFVGYAMNY